MVEAPRAAVRFRESRTLNESPMWVLSELVRDIRSFNTFVHAEILRAIG